MIVTENRIIKNLKKSEKNDFSHFDLAEKKGFKAIYLEEKIMYILTIF